MFQIQNSSERTDLGSRTTHQDSGSCRHLQIQSAGNMLAVVKHLLSCIQAALLAPVVRVGRKEFFVMLTADIYITAAFPFPDDGLVAARLIRALPVFNDHSYLRICKLFLSHGFAPSQTSD